MEPQIQYVTTRDNVQIAYLTIGSGPPVVFIADLPWSNLQFEFRMAVYEQVEWQRFWQRWTLVRFDPRGMGMSDRTTTRFGLDTWVIDMEAVVDALELDTFALQANGSGGPLAIAYAARHPERISHLILEGTGARPAEAFRSEQSRILGEMLSRDYEMFSENVGAVAFGWGREEARNFGEFIRACATPEAVRHIYGALGSIDVSDLLGSIKASTLVIHRPDLKYLPIEMSRELAARIPNARLAITPGTYADPERAIVTAQFLEGGGYIDLIASEPPAQVPSGTAVILFADIVDSTALTERLGDSAFRDKARDLDTALRTIIRESGGTPVEGKLVGDGVLAVFTSARQAIEAALKCAATGDESGLPLHLGLHAGDVIEEDGNVFGGAVNIAARIAGESAPGEVLVSGTVRELARTSAGVAFEDAGERELKGVGEPVRVWRVRETG